VHLPYPVYDLREIAFWLAGYTSTHLFSRSRSACRQPLKDGGWCEVLDFVVLDREDDGSVEIGPREGFGGPQPTIILSRRDEPEQGKSRLHIDVNATDRDQDAELEHLLKLGARPADIGQTGQEQWHVLVDPEGNEFCLLKARLNPL
jgi:hypothetical protein